MGVGADSDEVISPGQNSKRGAEADKTAAPSIADVRQACLGAFAEKLPMSILDSCRKYVVICQRAALGGRF